ncbi:hypothetical protein K431DRAFT_198288, partial [Polychaeton citri CBS 116435]
MIKAITAYHQGQFTSIRKAAKAFRVPKSTLTSRLRGTTSQKNSNIQKRVLNSIEEEVLIQRILDLDARGFSP